MSNGPAPASRKVIELTGFTLAQMNLIELNGAFAVQGQALLRQLGLVDDEDARVNPNAVRLRWPNRWAPAGARLVTSAAYQLHRTGGRQALCTM